MVAFSFSKSGKLTSALEIAKKAHKGQTRASGEPYIEHPKAVVRILADILNEEDLLVAALLHDTIEDTSITSADIRREFGPAVTKLVEGVTKVGKIERDINPNERNMHSIRKMFRAMGQDLRVIFIKLADRMHNMSTIGYLRPDKQQRIALETKDIYCPLANLLGIRPWYQEMSDLCFQVLDPAGYALIERKKQKAIKKDQRHLQRWTGRMEDFLKQAGFKHIKVEIRPRHLQSVQDATEGQLTLLDHIETFFRVYVVTKKQEDCYRLLGYIHQFASALPHHINDYISHPKTNGYRALHTTVMTSLGNPMKVVIQSDAMDEEAIYGAALPYRKKKRVSQDDLPTWLDTLMSLEHDQTDMPHFFQALQAEIFGERCRVHVVGKTKQFIDLPNNASILDVAYYTDEALGKYATDAIVNSEEKSLEEIITDGDVIEIKLNKRKIQRRAEDLVFTQTSLAQKLLIETLSSLPAKERQQAGQEYLEASIDVLLDPFFSTSWRKALMKRLASRSKDFQSIGSGTINPFDLIEQNTGASDFFLLNPDCFTLGPNLRPDPKTRFVLRTSLKQLQSGNIIGQHVRPDVIDVHAVETLETEAAKAQSKEIVPLRIANPVLLHEPFIFALRWSFAHGSNPLKIIASLQSMLDTPIELLQFDRATATLGFQTASIQTLRIAYEYLLSQASVLSIVRTSP